MPLSTLIEQWFGKRTKSPFSKLGQLKYNIFFRKLEATTSRQGSAYASTLTAVVSESRPKKEIDMRDKH